MELFNHRTDQGYDYYHRFIENEIRTNITDFLKSINITKFLLTIDINKIIYKRTKKILSYYKDWYHPFEIILNINLKENNYIHTQLKLLELLKDMYMYPFIDIIIDESLFRFNNKNIKKRIKKINKKNKDRCTCDITIDSKNFFVYFIEIHDLNFNPLNLKSIKNVHYEYAYSIKFSDIVEMTKKINSNINESTFKYDFENIHQESMPKSYKNDYKQYAIDYYDFMKYLYDIYNGIYKYELEKIMNSLSNIAKGKAIFINYDL